MSGTKKFCVHSDGYGRREMCEFDEYCVEGPCPYEQLVEYLPVVRCKDCYLHGECMTEDAFHWSGIHDPYCAAGKKKGGPENGAKPY